MNLGFLFLFLIIQVIVNNVLSIVLAPILTNIYPLVPWPVFLAIYILGFSFVAMLICFVAYLIYKKGNKHAKETA